MTNPLVQQRTADLVDGTIHGVAPQANNLPPTKHHDLDVLAGTWSASEAENFLASIAPLEQVDLELWR